MERFFSEAFLLAIEKFIVVPLDSWFIANGLFVNQASNPQYIKAADNILAIIFFFVFSYIVHAKGIKPLNNPDTQSILKYLWIRFNSFAFKKKETEPLPPTE